MQFHLKGTTGQAPGARASPSALLPLTPEQLGGALRDLALYGAVFLDCREHAEQVREAAEEQTGHPYRVRPMGLGISDRWAVEPLLPAPLPGSGVPQP